jgi:hypothetical protein
LLHHFGFGEEEKEEGFFGAANADRLVALIQDKDLAVERVGRLRR